MSLIVWSLLLGFSQVSQAAMPAGQCLDAGRIQNINSEFQVIVDKDASGASAIPPFDRCDKNQAAYVFYQAMMFIEDLPPLVESFDLYDQNILGSSSYRFFADRIGIVHFDVVTSKVCRTGTAAAYVKEDETENGRGVMHLCPSSDQADLLYMANTLIHEARHVEGYKHVACEHGRLKSIFSLSCDSSYDFRGAYAVETEFNIRLARTESTEPSLREGARSLAVITFLENFNATPFDIRKGLITEETNGNVAFFDGKTIQPIFQLSNQSDLLVLRGQRPTVYDPTDGSVRSYLNAQQTTPTEGLYADLFRSHMSSDSRQELKDLLYLGTTSCLLQTKYILCYDGLRKSSLDLTTIRAQGLTVIANMVAIQDEEGYAYTIDASTIGTAEFNEERFVRTSRPLAPKSMVEWDINLHIGVEQDGVLRQYSALNQAGEVIPELAQARFRRVLGPAWWSSHLADF